MSIPLPSVSRRTLLRGLVAAPLLSGVAACGQQGDGTANGLTPEDALTRDQLLEIEHRVLAAYDIALAVIPAGAEREVLVRRRLRHQHHQDQITVAAGGQTLEPSASPVISAPLLTPPTSTTLSAMLRWVAANEQEAATAQRTACAATVNLPLARVAALCSAFERTHGYRDVDVMTRGDWTPVRADDNADVLDTLADALQTHHMAMWVLGRLGPQVRASEQGRARTMTDEHVRTRDLVRRALLTAGRIPPSPAPAYAITTPPTDATALRNTLRDLERSVAVAWLDVVSAARTEGRDRSTTRIAVALLGDAAIRAHAWGNREAFPGFGDRTLRYTS
jgi:hypothetical protein